jgi:hypothetical protein
MRMLVICRIPLAAAALIASASQAQRSERGEEREPPTQARSEPRESADSRDSSSSAESPPAPDVESPSPTRDDPAPTSAREASSSRSERPPETSEPGLTPHYREMEERNQRRYERERRREDDRDGGSDGRHHRDGGDGKSEHRHHHRHRYIDGPYDDAGDFGFYDDDSRIGEEIAMPSVGRRFDPEVCSLFTGVSGLLRNMFGNHRCRVLDPARYRLPAPGPGRLWLRVLKDAILVDGSDGTVVDIVRNAVH